jgi:uncharacterized protein YeaO (DUF488 family)
MILVKRIYEPPADSDGYRVLVDRLWPRGIAREKARIDEWLKDIAPSTELRKSFGHDGERWPEFVARYRQQLSNPTATAQLERLRDLAGNGTVTLLYAARSQDRNNAIALRDLLLE